MSRVGVGRCVAHASLVPRPSKGEEREGLVLTACACANFPGNFSVKMTVKVGGHVHGKVLQNKCTESHALHKCHTIWQVFLLSSLQSSKEDGQLDRHSLLETGLRLTVIIHGLTIPSNAEKSVTFLVQCSGGLKQARSVQTDRATAAEAYP